MTLRLGMTFKSEDRPLAHMAERNTWRKSVGRWSEMSGSSGERGRDLVLYVGRTMCGLKLMDLAREAGMREYAMVAMAVERYAGRLQIDARAQKELRRVMKMLQFKM